MPPSSYLCGVIHDVRLLCFIRELSKIFECAKMSQLTKGERLLTIQKILSVPSIAIILASWSVYLIGLGVYRGTRKTFNMRQSINGLTGVSQSTSVLLPSFQAQSFQVLQYLLPFSLDYHDAIIVKKYYIDSRWQHSQHGTKATMISGSEASTSGRSRSYTHSTVSSIDFRYVPTALILYVGGPILRINPHEIHINDPAYIDEVYAGAPKKRDKYKWIARMVASKSIELPHAVSQIRISFCVDDEAVVATVSHDLHRMRRAALNPYFSKASIRRLEPIIRDTVAKLLKRMDSHQKSGEVLPMTVVYKAMTSDIINNYAFGKSDNCMDMKDYNVSFFDAVEAIFEASHLSLQFRWLGPLMESLPMALTAKLMPGMAHLFKMQQVIASPSSRRWPIV
jgi:Cytochrome P450